MPFRLLLVLLLVPILFGCRAPDPSVELLEGELRWMEDQLYMLEDQLEKKCEELAALRSRGGAVYDALPSTRAGGGGTPEPLVAPIEPTPATRPDRVLPETSPPSRPRGSAPTVRPRSEGLEPDVTAPTTPSEPGEMTEDELENLQPPEITIPESGGFESETNDPTNETPLRGAVPQLEQPLPDPNATRDAPAGAFQTQAYLEGRAYSPRTRGIDADVTHIVVSARVPEDTSMAEAEGAWVIAPDNAGEPLTPQEMLKLVVQPRNKDGVYVALPGPVSIVVLDGSATGAEARVGRWDFDAAHCRRAIRKTEEGNGIHLEIPWEQINRAPEHLHVFVRYTAVDGRRLEDELALAAAERFDSATGHWTPSTRPPRDRRTATSPLPWSPDR